jgi:hypothetical protein
MKRQPFGRAFDIAFLVSLTVGATLAIAYVGLAPRDPANGVAVVFPPWTAADAALTRAVAAGSRFVRFGDLPFIAVVMPDDAGYVARIRSAGAWLVADPQALAACLSKFQRQ